MGTQVWVNASTSVVQIDTSLAALPNPPAIVYLSSIYSPGNFITIRDIAGQASGTQKIIISTTVGTHFLDGPQVSSYSITQPFGFITVNPQTSTIWALMNTFAFPDQSAAATLIGSLNANIVNTSTIYAYQALISTALISSLSTSVAYVQTNLSVGMSTIGNDIFLRSTLTAIGGISTMASMYASTSITTRSLISLSTLQVPRADFQFSTGTALEVGGAIRTASTISTIGPLYVGGAVSTMSDLAVGGSTLIAGQLRVGANTFLQSSLSTVGSFSLGGVANLASTLTTKDNAMFQAHVSVASNVTVGGYLSVMSSIYVKGGLQVDLSFLTYGNISTCSSVFVGQNMSIAGDLMVGGDLYFADRLLDLNNLSINQTLFVRNTISTYSSIYGGADLNILGSTLLVGPVSTASTLTVGSHLSTVGNLAIGGSVFFASTLMARGAVSTLSNVAVGGNLTVVSSTTLNQTLSTLGQAAFFSSLQVQGSVSVFSSLTVACNVTIGGILTAGNMSLPGGGVMTTLGLTSASGFIFSVSSSTLHQGLFSTMGGIDMAGRFSTPNAMAIGSTLFTSFATVQNSLSTLVNTNVGGDLNVLGKTILGDTLTANSYATFVRGLSTTTNANVGGNLNLLGTATVGGVLNAVNTANFLNDTFTTNLATFNGGITATNVKVTSGLIDAEGIQAKVGSIYISQKIRLDSDGAFFTDALTTTVGLKVISSTTLNQQLSSIGQAAFFSSIQVQGSMSVFSSIAVAWNLDVQSTLTVQTLNLKGGAVVSTLGVTSFGSGWGLNISSSTLAYGLTSTTGALNVGGATTLGRTLSTVGQAAFFSSVQIQGGLSVFSTMAVGSTLTVLGSTIGANATFATVVAPTSIATNALSSITFVTSNIAVNTTTGTPGSGVQVDITGVTRVVGALAAGVEDRRNVLILKGTNPGIVFSNANVNYNTYVTTGTNAGGANNFVLAGTDDSTRLFVANGATTLVGVNTNSPAYTLDVNGTAQATKLFTLTVGADTTLTSTLTAFTSVTAPTVNATTSVKTGNGTAGAPSHTFANATTAGLYTDGSLLGLATGGTNRMTVLGTGNVGVACNAPAYTLDVNGTAQATKLFSLTVGADTILTSTLTAFTSVTAPTVNATTSVKTANGTAGAPSHTFTNATTVGLYTDGSLLGLATGGAGRMTVLGTGNVGVACNAPAYTLDVNGTAQATKLFSLTVGAGTTLTSTLTAFTSVTAPTVNVTTSVNTANGSAAAPSYTFTNATTTGLFTDVSGGIGVATGGSARMYINSVGNVGVTQPSPAYSLDVAGTGLNTTSLYIAGVQFQPGSLGNVISTSLLLTSSISISTLTVTKTAILTNTQTQQRWVAAGKATTLSFFSSEDGKNWTTAQTGITTSYTSITGVGYNGSIWAAVGNTGSAPFLYKSSDANTWTPVTATPLAVTTYAGSGVASSTNGSSLLTATFNAPAGIAFDSAGNLYISESSGHCIRKITTAGGVSVFAGTPGVTKSDTTGFNGPYAIAFGLSGVLYVTEVYNNRISAVSPTGVISVFAGGTQGYADGVGTNARFYYPQGVTVDSAGNLYISDVGNARIRKISPAGVVTTFAGSGAAGSTNGLGTNASFRNPEHLACDSSGNIYVADWNTALIRKISPAGLVTTLAGSGVQSSVDGIGTAATFNNPQGITLDSTGNVYVTEVTGNRIRKITPNGLVTTLAGSTSGSANGTGAQATFNVPVGIVMDTSNNLYVADLTNNLIRKIALGTGDPFPTAQFNSITWNGNNWLLCGTSSSGTTNSMLLLANSSLTYFTRAYTNTFSVSALAAAWNGTIWMAVGNDGGLINIKYSSDGLLWTNATSGGFTVVSSSSGYCIAWNGLLWVAGGGQLSGTSDASLKYSYDGLVWTNSPSISLMATICRGLAWNGTVFVAVGKGTNTILYSYDGITWVAATGGFSTQGTSVSWNGSLFVAGGIDSTVLNCMKYSSDGITWANSIVGSGNASDNINTVAFSSNVTPDAVIGNISFYSKQPQFLTATNSVNMGSNFITINNGMKVTTAGTVTATTFIGALATKSAFLNEDWYTSGDKKNRFLFAANGTTYYGTGNTGVTSTDLLYQFKKSDGSTTTFSIYGDGSIKAEGTTTATTFIGALTGNVTGNVSGSSGSCTGNAATATRLNSGLAFVNDAWYQSADSKYRFNFAANGATYYSTGNTGVTSTDLLYQFKKSDASTTTFSIYGDGSITAAGDITAFSDGRYKKNIVTINDALDKVRQMRGVYYHKDDDLVNRKIGVIAQEMETVIPEAVMTDASEDKKKSVAYGNLTAVLIEAVKTLAERLERLEEKLASGQ